MKLSNIYRAISTVLFCFSFILALIEITGFRKRFFDQLNVDLQALMYGVSTLVMLISFLVALCCSVIAIVFSSDEKQLDK